MLGMIDAIVISIQIYMHRIYKLQILIVYLKKVLRKFDDGIAIGANVIMKLILAI